MPVHDTIVIGASAGGVEALKHLAGALPADLPAAIFIVVHFPPDSMSMLPAILNRYGPLPAYTAQNNEPIRPGRIYVAPPDYHLLVRDGVMQVYRGPRENHTRPAIDPLFRSAAQACGRRVVGVLLSGMLNDGTAGLIEIKRQGGLAIVQDPEDALFPDMPRSAVKNVAVDYVLPLARIATVLTGLVLPENAQNQDTDIDRTIPKSAERHNTIVTNSVTKSNEGGAVMSKDRLRTNLLPIPTAEGEQLSDAEYTPTQGHANVVVARTNNAQIQGERNEQPSIYSCPDCGGVLWQMNEHEFLRFRCHVGHAHSAESLLKQQVETLESSMWYAVRTLADRANLSRQLAEKARGRGHGTTAERFAAQAQTAERHAGVIRRLIENDLADREVKAANEMREERVAS